MPRETDLQLLQRHQRGDTGAFAELVSRHVNWVYSAARRRGAGADLPEDLTQAVFIALAKRPPRTVPHGTLSPWLFGTLIRTCKAALRARATRRRHETEAAKMRPQTLESPAHADWSEIAPHLEEMVQKLRSSDREIVLLRFYEQKSYPEIAELIGITEEAARKRVSRATEALRGMLCRRRVSMPAAAVAGVLVAETVKPAPAGVAKAASIAAASVKVPTSVSLIYGAATLMAGTKLNTMIVGAIALLLAISAAIVVVPWNRTTGAAVASAAAPAVTSDQDWRTRFDETYMLKEGEVLKRVAPPFIPEREFFWDDYARALAERGGRSAQHSYPLVFFRQNETLQLSAVVSGSQASIGTILNFGFRLNSYEWDDSPAFDLRLSGDWVIRDNADVASLMSALGSILRSEFNRPLRFVSRPTAQQVVIVTGRYAYRRIADPAGAPEVVHITIGPPADSTGRRGIVRGSLQTFLESAGHHVRLRFIDQTDQPSLVNLFWIEHESAAALATMKPGPEKDAAITQLLNSLHSQTGLTYTLEWQTLPVWYLASAPSDLILFADRPVPEGSVIDLDTGAVLAMPADIQWFGRDLGPRLEWTKRTGGDVWVHTVGNPVGIDGRANDLGGLFGCDMVVEPVAPSFWDGATLELITSRLQGKPHIVDQAMRPMGRFPATFLFKTRSGAIGILQIMSFNQDPRSAVIRYKVSP